MAITSTSYFRSKILAAAKDHTSSGNFDGPLSPGLLSVGLYTNDIGLSADTVTGDLTEAGFDNYSQFTPVVWLDPVYESDGSYTMNSDVVNFSQDGVVVSETVRGYFVVTSADSGKLLFAEAFETPFSMNHSGKGINLSLQVAVGDEGVTGTATIIE